MELFVNQIERVETNHLGQETETGWSVHLVSTLDEGAEIAVWGDIQTDRPEIAAQFALGQRWTLG
jgi:hypothetical protein